MVRRWVLLALLLLTAPGCGGAGPGGEGALCGPNLLVRVRAVATIPGFRAGETDRCQNPTLLTVLSGMAEIRTRRTIAHELCHAAGLVQHESNPACVLYEVVLPILPAVPCPSERARMQAVTGSFVVIVESPELLDAVTWAVDFWNAALGRPLFTIG